MTNSIFDKNTYSALQQRLNQLSGSSAPLWGKMNVAQMLAHCNQTLEMSLGKIQLEMKSNIFMRWIVKPMVLSNKPFGQNLPTSPGFIIVGEREFENEKSRIVKNIEDAHKRGLAGEWKPHLAFGKLKPEEWGPLTYKHLDHHFRQFGV